MFAAFSANTQTNIPDRVLYQTTNLYATVTQCEMIYKNTCIFRERRIPFRTSESATRNVKNVVQRITTLNHVFLEK